MAYIWRQMTKMKKGNGINQFNAEGKLNVHEVSEPMLGYSPAIAMNNFIHQTGYTYSNFQRIAQKLPIKLRE